MQEAVHRSEGRNPPHFYCRALSAQMTQCVMAWGLLHALARGGPMASLLGVVWVECMV